MYHQKTIRRDLIGVYIYYSRHSSDHNGGDLRTRWLSRLFLRESGGVHNLPYVFVSNYIKTYPRVFLVFVYNHQSIPNSNIRSRVDDLGSRHHRSTADTVRNNGIMATPSNNADENVQLGSVSAPGENAGDENEKLFRGTIGNDECDPTSSPDRAGGPIDLLTVSETNEPDSSRLPWFRENRKKLVSALVVSAFLLPVITKLLCGLDIDATTDAIGKIAAFALQPLHNASHLPSNVTSP